MTLISVPKNDSTKLLTVNIPGMMQLSMPLGLRSCEQNGKPCFLHAATVRTHSSGRGGGEDPAGILQFGVVRSEGEGGTPLRFQ